MQAKNKFNALQLVDMCSNFGLPNVRGAHFVRMVFRRHASMLVTWPSYAKLDVTLMLLTF